MRDVRFENGVIGKVIVYNMEERQRVKIVDYVGSKEVETSKIDEELKKLDDVDPGVIVNERSQHRNLSPRHVGQRPVLFPRRFAVEDPLVGPQQVHRGENDAERGGDDPPPVLEERPEQDQELADEAVEARQAERDELLAKEKELTRARDRVNAEADLKAKYGDAWDQIAKARAALPPYNYERTFFESGLGLFSNYFNVARTLVRWADESQKPNGQRLPEYSEARKPAIERQMASMRCQVRITGWMPPLLWRPG